MKFRNYIKILFLLLATAGITGCVQEYGGGESPIVKNSGQATITINIPGQQIPTTRSMTGIPEATVESIDILVFDKDANLTQHVEGTSIAPIEGDNVYYSVTFKASLTANDDARTVAVIANAAERIDEIMAVFEDQNGEIKANQKKVDVLAALTHSSDGEWETGTSYAKIPMYGEKTVSSGITSGMKIENVPLVRMLARVDVVNSATSDFTLTDVYVVNYNTKGYIAQAWDETTGALLNPQYKAEPMVPSGANPLGAGVVSTISNALHYSDPSGEITLYRGEIYLYEAKANPNKPMAENIDHTKAVCLIVKGTWAEDGKEYYYRIDFTGDNEGLAPDKVEYVPVYRNHLYTFDITAVNGVGYGSFDDALKSFGLLNNLKTKLHVVDQTGVTNMVFNGQHYIGLGDAVIFGYEQSVTPVSVPCVTNYWEGWEIEKITYEPSSDGNWLTTTPAIGASPDPTIKKITLATGSDNIGPGDRVAYVHVKAGRLTHQLKVTQKVFVVSQSILNFGYGKYKQTVLINTNISLTSGILDLPAWCTITRKSGLECEVTVTPLDLNALEDYDYKRVATTKFKGPDGSMFEGHSLILTQYAPVAIFDEEANAEDPAGLPAVATIPAAEFTYTVHIKANVPWLLKTYSGGSSYAVNTATFIIDSNNYKPEDFDSAAPAKDYFATIKINKRLMTSKWKLLIRLRHEIDTEPQDLTVAGVEAEPNNIYRKLVQTGSVPFAPPGVIGYIWNPGGTDHLKLTLKGSKEYKDTLVDEHSEFGKGNLESSTVYVAFFKWGSLIAIGSHAGSGEPFTVDDVIAAPTTTELSSIKTAVENAGGGENGWALILPTSPDADWPSGNDPCQKYFGDSWRMPKMVGIFDQYGFPISSWRHPTTDVAPFEPYDNSTKVTSNDPNPGRLAVKEDYSSDWSIFLPYSGYRGTDGKIVITATAGHFWSSTKLDAISYLLSGSSGVRAWSTDGGANYWARSIRCFKVD